MKIFGPEESLENLDPDAFSVFLAGGMKKPWRDDLIAILSKSGLNVTIIDPSVDDWEKDVGEENIDNDDYVKQSNWEHDGLEKADINVFHFDSSSLSPITLFELGLSVDTDSIMYVEDSYEKRAYVEFIALRFGVPIVKTLKELAALITVRYHTR